MEVWYVCDIERLNLISCKKVGEEKDTVLECDGDCYHSHAFFSLAILGKRVFWERENDEVRVQKKRVSKEVKKRSNKKDV